MYVATWLSVLALQCPPILLAPLFWRRGGGGGEIIEAEETVLPLNFNAPEICENLYCCNFRV